MDKFQISQIYVKIKTVADMLQEKEDNIKIFIPLKGLYISCEMPPSSIPIEANLSFSFSSIVMSARAFCYWRMFILSNKAMGSKIIKNILPIWNILKASNSFDIISKYNNPIKNIPIIPKKEGRVHESPKICGNFGYLKNPLIHLTAQSMSQMFTKSIKWAKIEAKLIFQNNYPKVTILKVIKAISFEFINRFFIKKGFLDGRIGLVESVYQALHKAMILTYLWEMQTHGK